MSKALSVISLADVAGADVLMGTEAGRVVYQALSKIVGANAQERLYRISLDGVRASDGVFARESLLKLAKLYRGEKGVLLVGSHNRDLLDNWGYAADAFGQPLVYWSDSKTHEFLGKQTSSAQDKIIEAVMRKGEATSVEIASDLGISVPNASTQMNRLKTQGYLIRNQYVATTGGLEYMYLALAPSNVVRSKKSPR